MTTVCEAHLFCFSICFCFFFFFYFHLSVSPLVSTSIYIVHDLSETVARGVFVLNIILNNILLFSKINHILFKFFKFFLSKSNLVIRTLNSNNIRIQHPNEPKLATLALNRFFVIKSIVFSSINSFYKKHNLHGHYLCSLYCFALDLNLLGTLNIHT
jgi:hypothetical protein